MLPIGALERAETPLDSIRIVAARVHPQHHPCARVHKLSGHQDFIADARGGHAPWYGHGVAPGQYCNSQAEKDQAWYFHAQALRDTAKTARAVSRTQPIPVQIRRRFSLPGRLVARLRAQW